MSAMPARLSSRLSPSRALSTNANACTDADATVANAAATMARAANALTTMANAAYAYESAAILQPTGYERLRIVLIDIWPWRKIYGK